MKLKSDRSSRMRRQSCCSHTSVLSSMPRARLFMLTWMMWKATSSCALSPESIILRRSSQVESLLRGRPPGRLTRVTSTRSSPTLKVKQASTVMGCVRTWRLAGGMKVQANRRSAVRSRLRSWENSYRRPLPPALSTRVPTLSKGAPGEGARDAQSNRSKRRARQQANAAASYDDMARNYESGLLAASLSDPGGPEHLEFMRMQSDRLGEEF